MRLLKKFPIKKEKYQTYVSEFVIAEIEDTRSEEKRKKLFDTLVKYPIEVLQIANKAEVNELAQKYIDAGIIPKNKVMDALDIATCIVYGITVLVSWNLQAFG